VGLTILSILSQDLLDCGILIVDFGFDKDSQGPECQSYTGEATL